MRGRGRGSGRGSNQPRWTRGSGDNRGPTRNSTRNWERAPASGAPPGSASKGPSGGSKATSSDDRSGLEWLPSVSRSSGLEPNGDALRSFETQQEYWDFIVEKILNLEVPGRVTLKASERQEKESNAMILLRKLREGFVATDRKDDFAIQVVEKSTYLSLLYNSPVNIASSFSYLLDAYSTSVTSESPTPAFNQPAIGLLHFLHTLIDEFPSQRASHRLILQSRSTTQTCLARDCPERSIACEIASALGRNNWWALEKLTSPAAVLNERLKNEPWVIPPDSDNCNEVFLKLPQRALVHLLQLLRVKVRSCAWPVLRSAYREVVRAPWLEQSLFLPKGGGQNESEDGTSGLSEFMRGAVERSEAAVKDAPGAANDIWILRRPVSV